ncbi:MAG TPA: CoA-binding protein [Candidatus Limnocylindria bacterium]|nr:CoA-binding protein [Candidatus Limnocylindria bacterium]
MNETAFIQELLTGGRTIAVVGYSSDSTRPSNSVSRYLRGQGFRIIPVNPMLRGAVVDGEQAYDHLVDIPEGTPIDLVDVFRRGEFLDQVVDDAVAAKIPAIWFQLALGNIEAARRAEAAGLRVVWDRCTAIEHRRLRAR